MTARPIRLRKRPEPPSDQDIYTRIFEAILERRLQPGAPLREAELAQMFGVGRTKVRQALVRLVQAGVVEQRLNQGARVANPTRRQAREIFELRGLLEPALAGRVAESATPEQVRLLHDHVAREELARNRGNESELIRLTGEFHLLLARLLDNQLLDQRMLAIEALTCLSILAYTRSGASACLPDEHSQIVAAIERGETGRVRDLMVTHLHHVREDLDLSDPRPVRRLSDALGLVNRPTRKR
jgi:DNA-binding GntR family transcriptional regulator